MKYVPQPIQSSLFRPPYRFIFDTNVILAQNPKFQPYPRSVNSEMWRRIDELVKEQEIVTCGQIAREIEARDDFAHQWFKTCGIKIIEEDESIQRIVKQVVNEHPDMIKLRATKTSSGDAFLIATAIEHDLIIVTQEKKTSPIKIPQIADCYGIKSVNLMEFCEMKGWAF